MNHDYTVRLQQVFQGPMDLLLHLVREQEVEIHEIEITRVIEGYLQYVTALTDMDIEVAGEFTVMAATLMAIKSRSLLPQEEVDLEDELDPRDELIERLMEYRRFKETSDELGQQHDEQANRFGRGRFHEVADGVDRTEVTLDMGELTQWDLLATFSRLMRETLADRPHTIAGDPRPLRYYVQTVAARIRVSGTSSLRRLIGELGDDESTKESLVGSFCALLELIRLGLVTADQDAPNDDIEISFVGDDAESLDDLIRAAQFEDESADADELLGDLKTADKETEPNENEPAEHESGEEPSSEVVDDEDETPEVGLDELPLAASPESAPERES